MATQLEKTTGSEWGRAITYAALILVVLGIGYRGFSVFLGHIPQRSSANEKETSWRTYNEQGFSVDLPSKPTVSRITGTAATGAGYREYDVYSAHNGKNIIIIEVMEYLPTTNVSQPEKIIAEAAAKVETVDNVKIFSSSRSDFKGSPAYRVSFMDPNNNQWTKALLLFWDGSTENNPSRYYTVSELSSDGRYDEEDFDRIVDSFTPH